jgi:hypothetical protein
MKRYVIYDSDRVWTKVYKTFNEAYAVVIAKVNSLNQDYIESPYYNYTLSLPSSMNDYNIHDTEDLTLVATINDEINVFIQMIDVD